MSAAPADPVGEQLNKKRGVTAATLAAWAGPAVLLLLGATVAALPHRHDPQHSQHIGSRSLTFEANRGQFDAEIRYIARTENYLAAIDARGLQFQFADNSLRLDLAPQITSSLDGAEKTSTTSHYYGQQAISDVPHYGEVWYRKVSPGTDLRLRARGRQLEYDFVLQPHTSPETIRFRFADADEVRLDAQGSLVVRKGKHTLVQHRPHCYVERGRTRSPVPGRFDLRQDGSIGFQVAAFDRSATLVIDPIVSYRATYLGGEKFDSINDMAVDVAGNVFVTGTTYSASIGGFSTASPGGNQAYAAKLGANGQSYFTFLGGAGEQTGRALALLPGGGVAVVGETSQSWPAIFGTVNGPTDAFVVALNSTGQLTGGRLLGGAGIDYGHGVATDDSGRIYIAGETWSTDFPTTPNAHIESCMQRGICVSNAFAEAGANGFWALFNVATNTLEYSTYLGGSRHDKAHAIAVVSSGIVHVGGETASEDFPKQRALQNNLAGKTDGFIATYQPSQSGNSSLLSSTYFGGTGTDAVIDLATDKSGRSLFVGETDSGDLPLSAGAFDRDCGVAPDFTCTASGMPDGFVAVIEHGSQTALGYSSYLGGSGEDAAEALAAPDDNTVWIAGETMSDDFPVTDNAADAQCGKDGTCDDNQPDAFLARIRFGQPGAAAFAFGTYFGGTEADAARAVAVRHTQSGDIHAYIAGITLSPDLASAGAHDPLCGNNGRCDVTGNDFFADDGFVAEFQKVTDGKLPQATPAAPPRRSQSSGSLDLALIALTAWFLRRRNKKTGLPSQN